MIARPTTVLFFFLISLSGCVSLDSKPMLAGSNTSASQIHAAVFLTTPLAGDIFLIRKVDGETTWANGVWGSGYAKSVLLSPGNHVLEFRYMTAFTKSGLTERWLQGDGKLTVEVLEGRHYVAHYDSASTPGKVSFWIEDKGHNVRCAHKAIDVGSEKTLQLVCQ